MSITKESLEVIVDKLKKHSALDTSVEITFLEAYNLSEAYDSFWSRQYLALYIYQLSNILDLYEANSLSENNYFTEEDVLNIFNKSKELLFYLTKTPYELLS
jgi:hypothetical protein